MLRNNTFLRVLFAQIIAWLLEHCLEFFIFSRKAPHGHPERSKVSLSIEQLLK